MRSDDTCNQWVLCAMGRRTLRESATQRKVLPVLKRMGRRPRAGYETRPPASLRAAQGVPGAVASSGPNVRYERLRWDLEPHPARSAIHCQMFGCNCVRALGRQLIGPMQAYDVEALLASNLTDGAFSDRAMALQPEGVEHIGRVVTSSCVLRASWRNVLL